MSATKLQAVGGWCPLVYQLVADERYGLTGASVFGVVWQHCQRRRGVCYAAQDTLAEMLNVTRKTVNQYLGRLVEDGYIEDLTPNLRNRPHTYRDTGRLNVEAPGIPEVTALDTGVTGGVTGGVTYSYMKTLRHKDDEELASGKRSARVRDDGLAASAARRSSAASSELSSELVTFVQQQLSEWWKDVPPSQDEWWKRIQSEYLECERLNRTTAFYDCFEHYARRHPKPIAQLPAILHRALPGWDSTGLLMGGIASSAAQDGA
ncbi:MAG: winged helix-turn-helix domain-containing protein [Chloroflexota bacterium]